MPITANDVRPFFQVLIFKVPEGFDLPALARVVTRHINTKNAASYSTFEKQTEFENTADTWAVYYKHTQHPSWFKVDRAAPALEEKFRNREFDLVVLHLIEGYLFLHSSCTSLSDRIKEAILRHKIGHESIYQPSTSQIRRVLNNVDLKLSSIALDNIFGAGGTAPEGKAYYSPDAANCLTAGFDSGYALKNFFGRDQANQSRPVGGSSTKKKIWRSWVESIHSFKTECESLRILLETDPIVEKLPILVKEIDPFVVVPDDYAVFNMSCVVDERLVRLEFDGVTYGDWSADLDPDHNDRIRITLLSEGAVPKEIEYEFVFRDASHDWVFGPNGDDILSVKFADEEGNEFANVVPLDEYLNSGTGFTFLFSEGRAYSNGSFTKNNRFTLPFARADAAFVNDWSDVKLTREVKEDAALTAEGKITIIEKMRQTVAAMTPRYLIKDDGANEIADHVVLFNSKVILSHAKASAELTAGLRVGDLQVVCSQAIKSMRFFSREHYSEDSLERLHGRAGIPEPLGDFKTSFETIFGDFNLEKECWIVQPGISNAELMANPNNKIHTILNYVEGICRSNGVMFKLICSP